MKKIILLLLISVGALAQNVSKIDTGTINGAGYRILFPENWKGKLLMYAHGYEFMGTPVRQSNNPDWPKGMTTFLQEGFAVAASDYAFQGLAMVQGIEDTEALRQYFVKTYGQPDTTIVAGHSMGGGITIATLENFGEHYDGGLPMCPLAGRIYLQTRKEFDLFAIFNGLFPGIATPLKEIMDPSQKPLEGGMGALFGKAMPMKKAMFEKDSMLVLDIARRFDMKPDDLPFALAFGEGVLRDVAIKTGGNPYDNTNTIYGGFKDNLKVNLNAVRMAATVSQGKVFNAYDRTGEIDKPTVVLHTMYDQLIPADYAIVKYENILQKAGNQENFVVKYTNGQGHCNFTPGQTSEAFNALRNWIKTGERAKPGYIE